MIHTSGYFEVNPRFSFLGKICLSDGITRTQNLVTKRHALEIGEALVGVNMTEEEWKIIRQQILSSDLVDRSDKLERLAQNMEDSLDELIKLVETIQKDIEDDYKDSFLKK